ncbi:hypothetical protein GSY69_10710 [Brevibacterium sp. 5221]|uniref:AMP-dependent synthetase/ligase domain-containing protein n=1 Tax=Brevibacterium rongguiense TaxID=2695267 RepID=A0A6N9H8R9_9MICO|nr:hypothetical protein [Brevibacterium rongguiense]MYM20419.1 hypothetical protein [Brevibacterium rongguiense]
MTSEDPQPVSDTTALIAALARRPGPALAYSGADGALELTGRVCANWAYKGASLLAEAGVGPDCALLIVVPPAGYLHWRALLAALSAAALGAPVRLARPSAEPPDGPHAALAPEALAEAAATAGADELFVYAEAPLALAAEAPAETRDYNAEIRAHPDVVALAPQGSIEFSAPDSPPTAAPVPAPAPGAVELAGWPRDAAEAGRAFAALAGGLLSTADAPGTGAPAESGPPGAPDVGHATIGAWTK